MKPLDGIRVLEIASIGPGPLAANTFLELGAEVIRVNNPNSVDILASNNDPSLKNRINITVDLKDSEGVELINKLLKGIDILLEGNRPNVMEKIGLGPNDVHSINSEVIYIRLTGWGQEGTISHTAGHDINYLALSGILSLLGKQDTPPNPPINLLADYGSGTMFAVVGGLLGIHEVKNNNRKNITYDVAMFEGASYLGSLIFGLKDSGMWKDEREENLLDGGAPFYRCYATKDNKYVAVGALEKKFYKQLIEHLGLPESMVDEHMQYDLWPKHTDELTRVFLTKTRDEWGDMLENTDCCVTPVLDLDEAREHPHPLSRGSFYENLPRSNNILTNKNEDSKKSSIYSIFEELMISQKFIDRVEKNGVLSIE